MIENPLAMEVALLCHMCRCVTRVYICLLVPLAMRTLRTCKFFYFFFKPFGYNLLYIILNSRDLTRVKVLNCVLPHFLV